MTEGTAGSAERHSKELADAKRQGAEEKQQKFANMSWLERIQKKYLLDKIGWLQWH